jgi:hypothetical protein
MARETQDNRIARTAAEVWDTTAQEAGELAFVSRILVQAFLPHSDPKDIAWQRINGNFTLTVKSGIGFENGKSKTYGVPYGAIPRLLLAWLNSEAIKNAQDKGNINPQRIYMGRSLSEFLEKIGIQRTGGKRGGITSFKNQAEKLFRAEITVTCTGAEMISERDIKVSDGRFFFWDSKNPEQTTLWESAIELSERFYSLLIQNPVPLDWRVLKAIKQSPMALDLYMWLSHRMSYIEKPVVIQWETLQKQLGSDVERVDNFRQKVRLHLKKLNLIWRNLKVDASKAEGIYLYPTTPLISKTKLLLRSGKVVQNRRN